MILRKPYALLIKHFQKIHLILILLGAYIFYKTTILYSFVRDVIATQSYDASLEPISQYLGFLPFFILICILAIVIILMVLLHYKKKPWKIYWFVLLAYIFLFGVFIYIYNYFATFDEYSTLTSLMAGRDLLLLAQIPQYIIFVIFGIRFLGIDLKKFGFNKDEEYLAIREEDREEFEVNIELDKDKLIRRLKKFWRHTKYAYLEHRFLFHLLFLIVIVGISGYTYYYFGIVHKTYREGQSVSANRYDMTVNASYLTERSTNGTLIDTDSSAAFLVVTLTVTNQGSPRAMNVNRFHLINKNQAGSQTTRYNAYFSDLGTGYDQKTIDTGATKNFFLVFRVNKDWNPGQYVLYYQDVDVGLSVKKIKLDVQDMREITTKNIKEKGETMTFSDDANVAFQNAQILAETTYSAYSYTSDGCQIRSFPLTNQQGKILELSFTSDTFDNQSLVDFLLRYAKINYKDNQDTSRSIEISSAVRNYTGNMLYLNVPSEIDTSKEIDFVFTFRNERYIYHLN